MTAAATDVDVPAQTLTFSLVDAPAGAAINGTTGVFTWTPTEAQGPGDYTFRVRVSDGTASDEGWVTLRVTEVNKPPVLTGVPAAATIPEMVAYTFDANATDSDLPAQTLTFSLVGAPTGAAIDPASGVFTWTPSEAQGPGTYPFTVRVSDGVANTDQGITLTVVELDFGDAPDGYKTLLASNGARHVIVSGIHLGAAIDTEPDGQPSADALADDNTGTPDDEDGLTATTLIVGAPVTVTVTVVGHGYLSAWMDWNDDGDWLDQDEQIADDQELVTGTYPFPLTVPAHAASHRRHLCPHPLQFADGPVVRRCGCRRRSRRLPVPDPGPADGDVECGPGEHRGERRRGDVHGHAVVRDEPSSDGGFGLQRHGDADGRLHAERDADRDRGRFVDRHGDGDGRAGPDGR